MAVQLADRNKSITEETIKRYENYINPSLARLFRFMGLDQVEYEAEGSYIRDLEGNEYIDFLGGYGVFCLGHRHPRVVKAVSEQLSKMPLASKVFFDRSAGELAELLAKYTPGDLQYTFFCNSGAEAVEGALKVARLATGKSDIIATENSFHGKTLGALSATGRDIFRGPCEPLMPGFTHVPFGDADAVAGAINESTAAVIVEPIQGEGGIIIPPEDYLPRLRKICDDTGTLLILDEVQTGMGRTGQLFASSYYKVTPDIMTLAKALGGGIMPIGAFIARPGVWDVLVESPFLHTSTFGGNPMACAAAVEAIRITLEEDLPDQARKKGEFLLANLTAVAAKYPQVIFQVRGLGLMIGIELTKEGAGGCLMSELINRGFIVAYTLNNPKVIRLEPPLNIEYALLERFLEAFGQAIEAVNGIIDEL